MILANYLPFYKRTLQLAMPVVISQIGQVSVSLIDNMMVGHIGTTELAASSFANSVFMIGMFFGMGITFGVTPLVGKSFGENNKSEIIGWLKNAVFTHLAVAVVLCAVMIGVYFTLPLMGQPPEVTKLAQPYFLFLCASYIPFMLFFSIKQFFEGNGNTNIAMQITIVANLLNIIFNYLLIYGKFGFPEMGLNGAGAGTLIARIAMPVLFFVYVFRMPVFKRYMIAAHSKPFNTDKIVLLLRIGIPIGFQIVVEVTAFGIGAIMMGWLGEVQLAAHQVALGLASFTYMISLGISQANTIRVSHQVGENDYKSLKLSAYASTHLVLAFMSVMGLIFIFTRHYLPYLFTTDKDVIIIASGLLIIAAFFQVFDGLQVVMLSTLRGMADVKIPMFFAFFAYMIIGIPVSYFLTFKFMFGPAGIWYGYLAGLGVAGILFYFRFKYNLKKME